MWRAPDQKRSSRSRGCPSPARCPTRRPPRSRARPRRPPAVLMGAWPTAGSTPRRQRSGSRPRGVLRSLTRLRRGPPATGARPWRGGHPRAVLHPERFVEYLTAACGHDRLLGGAPATCPAGGPPGGWPGPSTVNHHLASVSGFLAWVVAQGCGGLPEGSPAAGVRTLVLPPP